MVRKLQDVFEVKFANIPDEFMNRIGTAPKYCEISSSGSSSDASSETDNSEEENRNKQLKLLEKELIAMQKKMRKLVEESSKKKKEKKKRTATAASAPAKRGKNNSNAGGGRKKSTSQPPNMVVDSENEDNAEPMSYDEERQLSLDINKQPLRIYLEIGHEASIRTKKTQEGFTHDWEVFVRGCDGAAIQNYIEKVVFYLHETFPKPRRVVKEPPYSVRESGYGGFNLPIDIYLRNSSDPKKLQFNYDLHLQHSGAPMIKVQTEQYLFCSPPEDFKMKLLNGGAMVGASSSMQDITDRRSSLDDEIQILNKPQLSGSDFVIEHKNTIEEPCWDVQDLFGSPINMSSTMLDQEDQEPQISKEKAPDEPRTKHSPHKDSHKDKEKKEKMDEKKSRDEKKQKDRERGRDKAAKKDKSPRPQSPSPKKPSPVRFSSPSTSKHKDFKPHDKKEKTDERRLKKESKEHKENKYAEEKRSEPKKEDKIKIDSAFPTPPKPPEKKEKNKYKSYKEDRYSEKSEKYKHKKQDKEKRDKKEERIEKMPEKPPKPDLFRSESKKPHLLPNNEDDSSNSSSSSAVSAERQPENKKPETVKIKEEKNQKLNKEKGYQENAINCKRKLNSVETEEPPEKIVKDHRINSNSEAEQEGRPAIAAASEDVEEDYFILLRDLQHRIIGLKDNSDLQKVVKLIAESGRYEVSDHTLDFDLCLLDRSTVQQLQDFFASES